MRNLELCAAFVNGNGNGKTKSMHINYDGKKLFSYGTCIAEKLSDDLILINDTKYSPTTSKHQYYLRAAITDKIKVKHTNKNVPIGTYSLTKYC